MEEPVKKQQQLTQQPETPTPQRRSYEYADPNHRIAAVVQDYASKPEKTVVLAPDRAERQELTQLIPADLYAQAGCVRRPAKSPSSYSRTFGTQSWPLSKQPETRSTSVPGAQAWTGLHTTVSSPLFPPTHAGLRQCEYVRIHSLTPQKACNLDAPWCQGAMNRLPISEDHERSLFCHRNQVPVVVRAHWISDLA